MTQTAFIRLAVRLTLIYAAAFCGAAVVIAFTTHGVILTEKGVVGGDFLAFYTAGDFARMGDALSAYDFDQFDAKLKERAPLEHLGMMWQYPPTMFFILAPFAMLPYKVSYIVWCAFGWAALLLALRNIGFRGHAFLLLGFSVLCVNVFDNGQISLLTAALLFLSVYDPKSRWIVAGIAAGLLTIKPQLGLLIPVAFLMIGAWRAIALAAVTALVLHTPALLIFGVEGWRDFFYAMARLNADVTGPGLHTPPNGMTTLFGQLRAFGAPSAIAVPMQYALAGGIAIAVAYVWRRAEDPLARAAVLCAGAILATPYAYGYEMTALLLPAAYIARQCDTYRSPIGLYLIGAALLVGFSSIVALPFGLQTPFLISASAFAIVFLMAVKTYGRAAIRTGETRA